MNLDRTALHGIETVTHLTRTLQKLTLKDADGPKFQLLIVEDKAARTASPQS